MGLGGAATAAGAVWFILAVGLVAGPVMALVAVASSDVTQRKLAASKRAQRFHLSRFLLPPALIVTWVAALVGAAWFGSQTNVYIATALVFAVAVGVSWVLGVGLRRVEYRRPGNDSS